MINSRFDWSTNLRRALVIFGTAAAMLSGYLSATADDALIPWLPVMAPLGIFIVLRPFGGLLLFVALLPLESAFLGLGGLTLTRLLGGGILGAWSIHVLIENRKIRFPVPLRWAIAFIGWAAISLLWTWDQGAATERLQTGVQLLLLPILIVNEVNSRQKIQKLLLALFSGCATVAGLGLLRMARGSNDWLLTLGEQGAKEYASYLVMAFLVATILGVHSTGRLKRLAWIVTLIMIVPIIAAGERGVILALVLAWFAILWVNQTDFKILLIVGLVFGVLYFAPVLLVRTNLVQPWIAERFTFRNVLETGGSGRTDIWKVGLALVRDNVWIGTGIGSFKSAMLHYVDSVRIRGFISHGRDPHGDWLSVAGELGMIGFLLYLALLISIGLRAVSFARRTPNAETKLLAITILGLFAYSFSVGLTSTYMWRKIYWLILGIATVAPDVLAERQGSTAIRQIADQQNAIKHYETI